MAGVSVGESKVSPVLGFGIYKKLGTLQRGPPGNSYQIPLEANFSD